MAALALETFADPDLTEETLLPRLLWLRDIIRPRLERYLGYYRNPTTDLAATLPCPMSASFAIRPFRQFQELGLPARITGFRRAADGASAPTGAIEIQRKEIVIENDIGWRINTIVDFTVGRMPGISSTAKDPAKNKQLTAVIQALFQAAGRIVLLQRLVLQGAITGSAWVHIRPTAELLARLQTNAVQSGGGPAAGNSDPDIASTGITTPSQKQQLPDVARWFRLEIVSAPDLCPLPRRGDAGLATETAPAYAALLTCSSTPASGIQPLSAPGILERVRSWFLRPSANVAAAENLTFDLFGAQHWQRYVSGVLTQEGQNLLGFVPFVRYENAADSAAGTPVGMAGSGAVDVGVGEVEPLIGLQDELNTRLSDRAYRVTMTSFRMWLGKGIEDFTKRPISPGQMWSTDNPNATIQAFGGDASTPSEDTHIEDIREALDKISGVPPIAAGVLREKIGNLTSAVALRITLIALLARTERKRAALNQTMAALVEKMLEALDRAGIIASSPEDRGIDVNWPTALPESDMDRLQEAQAKVALGIPRDVVLRELGYEEIAALPLPHGAPSASPA